MSSKTKMIAIASGKGGVGKSTVSANLAVTLGKRFRVGLMDADVYGPSQPRMLGLESAEVKTTPEGRLIPNEACGIKVISMGLIAQEDAAVVWRAPMVMKLIQQFIHHVEWGELDYLLIDLPPGTGDTQITLAQNAQLDGAVIVTTPQEVALGIAKKGLRMFEQVKVPILGIVENMSGFVCGHCHETTEIFKSGGGQRIAEEVGAPFLGSIPLDPQIVDSSDQGKPGVLSFPESSTTQAFEAIAAKLIDDAPSSSQVVPVEVQVDPDRDLKITWSDEHRSALSPYTLRMNCRCALCIDENTGKKILDPKTVPMDIAVESYSKVGRYALALSFSDRHQTGIYTFEHLRHLPQSDAGASLEV